MKFINIGITLSFIIVFAVATINIDSFLYSETAITSPNLSYYKSSPLGKTPPVIAEIIPPEKEIEKIQSIVNNEYFKGISGAAIGWAVKGMCEWVFNSIRKLMGAIRFRRG
jgi:hypothetical protein